MKKLTIDLKSSTMPVHLQFIEQGDIGKEFLAYCILTYFGGSFMFNALYEHTDWDNNHELHDSLINEFQADYGWDDQGWQVFFQECFMDSIHVNVIEL